MEYKRLGDYIREVNVRNREEKVTNLQGVSISKMFIPSIANTIGTDMSTYKIVKPGQFAYGPVTSRNGDKVSIALYEEKEDAIISQAYTVFDIIDKNKVSNKYLMMWFQRPEFDRYARFHSHGSAREIFDWDELCNVMIPLPSIERQREIVEEYETLSRRISLNEQMIQELEATAQALYRKMFVDNIDKENLTEGWRMGTLGDYAKVKSGYAFASLWWQEEGVPVIKIGDIDKNTIDNKGCDCVSEEIKQIAKNYTANKGDVVIAMTGATLGKIAIVPQDGFLVNQRVGIFDLDKEPLNKVSFLYCTLTREDVQKEIITVGGDSAQANISNLDIENIELTLAPNKFMDDFNAKCKPIFLQIIIKNNENSKLTELQSLLLAKMGQ